MFAGFKLILGGGRQSVAHMLAMPTEIEDMPVLGGDCVAWLTTCDDGQSRRWAETELCSSPLPGAKGSHVGALFRCVFLRRWRFPKPAETNKQLAMALLACTYLTILCRGEVGSRAPHK